MQCGEMAEHLGYVAQPLSRSVGCGVLENRSVQCGEMSKSFGGQCLLPFAYLLATVAWLRITFCIRPFRHSSLSAHAFQNHPASR